MKVFEVRLLLSLMKAHLKLYLLITASRSNHIRRGITRVRKSRGKVAEMCGWRERRGDRIILHRVSMKLLLRLSWIC